MKLLSTLALVLLPVAAPAETVGGLAIVPKPFMLWSYTFTTSGSQYDLKGRTYTTCTYLGFKYETVTKPAVNGRCPLIHVESPTGN